jgi:hypothetical protein
VTEEENNFMIAPFNEDKIKKSIFEMDNDKALESDGFPAEFY